jgi:hypothetical protein
MPLYVPDPKPQGTHDCRLEFISTNEIRLVPFGGDQIMIDGKRYTIPAGGVSLAPYSNLVGVNYLYVYAYIASGAVALTYGTDAPANDAYGMPVNPNSTWPPAVLVGIVCGGSTGFQMGGVILGVVSYWNRRQKSVRGNVTGTASLVYPGSLIGGAVYWVNFAGDTVQVHGSGTHHSNSGVSGESAFLVVDGSNVGTQSYSVSGGTGWWCPMILGESLVSIGVGTHSLQLRAWVGGAANAADFFCDLTVVMDA